MRFISAWIFVVVVVFQVFLSSNLKEKYLRVVGGPRVGSHKSYQTPHKGMLGVWPEVKFAPFPVSVVVGLHLTFTSSIVRCIDCEIDSD